MYKPFTSFVLTRRRRLLRSIVAAIFVLDNRLVLKTATAFVEPVFENSSSATRIKHENDDSLKTIFHNGSRAVFSTPLGQRSLALKAGRQRRSPSGSKNLQSPLIDDEQAILLEREAQARRRRISQMDQRLWKAAKREERIAVLEAIPPGEHSDAEIAELDGLRRTSENFEEQYDSSAFSTEHLAFKDAHNQAFLRLIQYCIRRAGLNERSSGPSSLSTENSLNVFFLDGPGGQTAKTLVQDGPANDDNDDDRLLHASQCYVANRHKTTCASLKQSGGGILPDENVVCATASEALTKGKGGHDRGALADVNFIGYYFDGCAGYAPHIINMMSAALLLLEEDSSIEESNNGFPIVVGYSLVGGPKQMIQNELAISRALTRIARTRGKKVVHALDDPVAYGIDPSIKKVVETTFTTWLLLEPV